MECVLEAFPAAEALPARAGRFHVLQQNFILHLISFPGRFPKRRA
jgi:hypothetical protein